MDRLLIFDLFGVILSKGLDSSIESLVGILNRPEHRIATIYRKYEHDFDLGRIDEKSFWEKITKELRTNVNATILSSIVLSSYRPQSKVIFLANYYKQFSKSIIYSNYRKEWFDRLDKKFKITSICDDVHISSETGLLKPDKEVFQFLSNHYGCDIKNMILVDDDHNNIESMIASGGTGIMFKNVFETEAALRKEMKDIVPPYDYRYSGLLLRTNEGALALQRRDLIPSIENPGKLSVFGGKLFDNESFIEAAHRELKEETKLDLDESRFKFLKVYGYRNKQGMWGECYYYLVDDIDVNDIILTEGQGLEIMFPEKALERNDLTELPRILINDLIREKKFNASK